SSSRRRRRGLSSSSFSLSGGGAGRERVGFAETAVSAAASSSSARTVKVSWQLGHRTDLPRSRSGTLSLRSQDGHWVEIGPAHLLVESGGSTPAVGRHARLTRTHENVRRLSAKSCEIRPGHPPGGSIGPSPPPRGWPIGGGWWRCRR